jgi:hypothetical protein
VIIMVVMVPIVMVMPHTDLDNNLVSMNGFNP